MASNNGVMACAPVDPVLRETAKALLLQGHTWAFICAKLAIKQGTLKAWIKRYGWTELKRTVHRTITTHVAEDTEVGRQSLQVKALAGRSLLKLAEDIGYLDTGRTKASISIRAKALRGLVEPAAKVFGWGTTGNDSTVTISIDELTQFSGSEAEPQSTLPSLTIEASMPGESSSLEDKACLPEPASPQSDGVDPLSTP